ncbi:MAG: LysR family transcriptional regulator [Cryobacterium sp.]|nr:LysR family transcriptional regulator [Oligoflexia bacterium]
MITLTQLEYVLAVDQYRNFGKAAKSCFVTQPTLSMQLKKLEDDLGYPLFDRTKKPILPTEGGKAVIEQARIVVGEWKRLALLGSRGAGKELHGELRIAVIPTLAPYWIPLFLEAFSKAYPKIQLRIDELQTEQILRALDTDEIDAGLLVTPLDRKKLREDPIFYEPFYLWIRKDHELAKKERVGEGDLDGSQIWLLNEGHCLRNQMIQICSLSRKKTILKNVIFESGNLETLKRLVERAGGYTLIPYLALPERLPKDIEVKSFRKPVPSREVSLVYRRLQWKTPLIEAFRSVLEATVPESLRVLKKSDLEVVGIE